MGGGGLTFPVADTPGLRLYIIPYRICTKKYIICILLQHSGVRERTREREREREREIESASYVEVAQVLRGHRTCANDNDDS